MASAHQENARPQPALLSPAVIAPLARALRSDAVRDFSGAMHVTGHPGGVFFLDRGAVTAVDSPGAPDVSTILLGSGRVDQDDWAAAVRAGATDGSIGAELIARKLIGAAELQVMCQMAALDGAFAISVGRIDGCGLAPQPTRHWLPARQGIDREALLGEIERRLAAIARGSISVAPYQDRLVLSPRCAGGPLAGRDHEQREILQRVNGRRSARDIAFMLGRSVYPIAVQVSRMLADGLIEITSRSGPGSGPSGSASDRGSGTGLQPGAGPDARGRGEAEERDGRAHRVTLRPRDPAGSVRQAPPIGAPLPRRRRNAGGMHEASPPALPPRPEAGVPGMAPH